MFFACTWTHFFTNSRHSYHCSELRSLNISSTTTLSSAPGHGRYGLPSVIRYALPWLLLASLPVQTCVECQESVLLVTSFEISRIATVVLQRTYYERF